MSQQFNLKRFNNGDIGIIGGVLVDSTVSPTETSLFGPRNLSAVSSDPETDSFVSPPNLSGGSGRNIYIFRTEAQTDIPAGTFAPLTNNKWVNGNGFDFTIEVNQTNGQILIKDSVDTVAIANLGSFRLHERIPCALAQSSGGPGTITKTVDLGTGTGTCSFQFASTGPACVFTIVWNSTTVVNVIGSGTVSFNKNLSSPTSAVVTVQSGAGSSWSYTLGCPGGGSPPYTYPAIGSPYLFNAASTSYGNSLNGGVAFTLTCRFENGVKNKTATLVEEVVGIPDVVLIEDGYQRYYDSATKLNQIIIKSTGAEITDGSDIIAIRPVNDLNSVNLTDPTGTYESTAYGMSKYGFDDPFFIDVTLNQAASMSGVHYYVLKLSSGLFSYADGPIFIEAPFLPANTSTTKYIPIGSYDATTNTLLQLWEGPILLDNIPNFGSQDIVTTGTLSAGVGSVISGSSSSDALRITQAGTGNALVVEDSPNPDSTPFVVDASGRVLNGLTAPISVEHINGGTVAPSYQQFSTGQGVASLISISSGAAPQTSSLSIARARGTSTTPEIVQDGDWLGGVTFQGYDGANYEIGARILAKASGTVGVDKIPTTLSFEVCKDGGTTLVEAMKIRSEGNVSMGDPNAYFNSTLNLTPVNNDRAFSVYHFGSGDVVDIYNGDRNEQDLLMNSNGKIAIGGSVSNNVSFYNLKAIGGSATSYGNYTNADVQSTATTAAYGYRTSLSTQAASFTLPNLYHYAADQDDFGAGSVVTNQFGFVVQSTLVSATNNYGFYSNINSATGRWAFYGNGTADNRFNGDLGLGVDPAFRLHLSSDSAAKPTSSTWTISSDERLKENIELADLDICYDAVKNIPLKRYTWRSEFYSNEQIKDRSKIGWIAQDVRNVFPKAVGIHKFIYNEVKNEEGEVISQESIDDCLSLNSDQIYATLYGAVQKLMNTVEDLQARIQQLENP
jgi:hypothetical protein